MLPQSSSRCCFTASIVRKKLSPAITTAARDMSVAMLKITTDLYEKDPTIF